MAEQPYHYVYVKSEPQLWTVGYYDASDQWHPESDQDTADAAALRVALLNGAAINLPPHQFETLRLAKMALADAAAAFGRLENWCGTGMVTGHRKRVLVIIAGLAGRMRAHRDALTALLDLC